MEPSPINEELLAGHVLGDLDSLEQQQFNNLLRDDPGLALEIERLQETLNLLPYTLPEEEVPSPLLRDKILNTVQTTPPLTKVTAPVQSLPVARPSFWPWLGSIAAVAAVVLGLDSLRLRQELSTVQGQLSQQQAVSQLLQNSDTKLVSFKGTTEAMQSSGNLLFTPNQTAILTLKDINPIPKSQVYRLWAIIDDKKIFCGDFTPDAQGKVLLSIKLAPELAGATLAVSLEPNKPLPQPTGPIVLISRS